MAGCRTTVGEGQGDGDCTGGRRRRATLSRPPNKHAVTVVKVIGLVPGLTTPQQQRRLSTSRQMGMNNLPAVVTHSRAQTAGFEPATCRSQVPRPSVTPVRHCAVTVDRARANIGLPRSVVDCSPSQKPESLSAVFAGRTWTYYR